MELTAIKEIMSTINPGTFFRCEYSSSIPLKAEYRNAGYKLIKVASIITRTGIHYAHIRGVDFDSAKKNYNLNRVNNFIWEDPYKISFNTNTWKYYLNLYPVQHCNCDFKFKLFMDDEEIEVCETVFDDPSITKMILPSYLKSNSDYKVIKVNINNISKIIQSRK
jgi:hypothetical protein